MPLTTVDPGLLSTNAQYNGFKNRIINGAMRIDQRNAGAGVTPTNNQYTLDRWSAFSSQTSKYTVQQSTTAPTGFINSMVFTSSSAYSVVSSDYFGIQQAIEGLNVSDLAWGTASASPVTISFWVRSSLTGTFGGSLRNNDVSRSYPFSYTINSANTWEQKSVTIAGDTTGTWLTTNGIGIRVWFSIGAGSTFSGTAGSWSGNNYNSATGATSVVGTNGATFYITGVQLEKGSTATSFDYRPYGTELALCQRYYQAVYGNATSALPLGARLSAPSTGSGYQLTLPLKVSMRTTPTCTRVGSFAVGNTAQPGVFADTELLNIYTGSTSSGDSYFYAPTSSIGVTISAEL
jgi:hypothetical protein